MPRDLNEAGSWNIPWRVRIAFDHYWSNAFDQYWSNTRHGPRRAGGRLVRRFAEMAPRARWGGVSESRRDVRSGALGAISSAAHEAPQASCDPSREGTRAALRAKRRATLHAKGRTALDAKGRGAFGAQSLLEAMRPNPKGDEPQPRRGREPQSRSCEPQLGNPEVMSLSCT